MRIALLSLLLAGTASADTIPVDNFDGRSTVDWDAECHVWTGFGGGCGGPWLDAAVSVSAPQSLHIYALASCGVFPFNGTSMFADRTVSVPNGTYRVDFKAKHHVHHYSFCGGATGGETGIEANGVWNTGTGCAVNNCGSCDADWASGQGCFNVTDGAAHLRIGTYAGDCGEDDGWVDDVSLTSLPGLAYSFPGDLTIACDASTDPSSTGQATVSGGCDPKVTYSDVASGSCPGTIERTWTVTDAAASVTQVQVITLAPVDRDSDDDGVNDDKDACPGTAAGAKVDANGCSAAQLVAIACPDNAPWANHGAYVSCVAHEANVLVAAGLIDETQKGDLVKEAAHKR
jgi:hypothetical protein